MLFNSQIFVLCYLPCVLGAFYALEGRRVARQWLLITASLVFYGVWDWRFVPALVALTFANWLVVRAWGRWRRPGLIWAGVGMNLLALGVCKYANFFAASLAALAGRTHAPWDIVLPLGISFFVFQKISYLVDLRRGEPHIYGLRDFFGFVTFFPQLIAGPLVRHNEIVPQFSDLAVRRDQSEDFSRGALLFVIGLAKKAAIADTIALVVDPLFAKATTQPLTAAEAWVAAGGYTLQIFYDFSGYSDMAIGLARMFGLRLPENFNAPYRATSIRAFWRRWHMTLSRFLRDYVYIPLGGNTAHARDVIVTMLLGGLWHGANWTFVAWGGAHGVALAVNGAVNRSGARIPAAVGWLSTTLFVVIGWVVFRSPDFATAGRILVAMAGANGVGAIHVDNAVVFAIAAVAAVVGPTSQQIAFAPLTPPCWIAAPVAAALVFLLLLIGGRPPNDFIYFQF